MEETYDVSFNFSGYDVVAEIIVINSDPKDLKYCVGSVLFEGGIPDEAKTLENIICSDAKIWITINTEYVWDQIDGIINCGKDY